VSWLAQARGESRVGQAFEQQDFAQNGRLMKPTVALAVESVSFAYSPQVLANRNINFELYGGEVLCILGPNGSGKTTLLKQIAASLQPSRGRILIFGQDLAASPRVALARMGIVPQQVGLFSSLTVRQHLGHFARLKGIPKPLRREACEQVIRQCHLGALIDTRAARMSIGEQRRTLLALALLGDPPLLVLDEPTTALDPESRRLIWNTLQSRRDNGAAILLTTHYMEEAQHLADRVAFLSGGRIEAIATPRELISSVGGTTKLVVLDNQTQRPVREELFADVKGACLAAERGKLASFVIRPVTLEDAYHHLAALQSG
jgi:ABC-type multidrug transport system ATPase subunit